MRSRHSETLTYPPSGKPLGVAGPGVARPDLKPTGAWDYFHGRKEWLLYTFADKQHRMIYLGGEKQYQRYKQLELQQSIAQNEVEAAELNEEASLDWWTPWGPWW